VLAYMMTGQVGLGTSSGEYYSAVLCTVHTRLVVGTQRQASTKWTSYGTALHTPQIRFTLSCTPAVLLVEAEYGVP